MPDFRVPGHPPKPLCPFTLRMREPSSLIATGEDTAPEVLAANCLGPACMAFVAIHSPDGKEIGNDCRRLFVTECQNRMAGALERLLGAAEALAVIQKGLAEAAGVKFPQPPLAPRNQ